MTETQEPKHLPGLQRLSLETGSITSNLSNI